MNFLSEIKWHLLLKRTYLRAFKGAKVKIGKNVTIKNSTIILYSGASLEIDDDTIIDKANITIQKGKCHVGSNVEMLGVDNVSFVIEDGDLFIGHHSRMSAKKIWIRFGGQVNIGNYTNINGGSEIRCDEKVYIGDYNQISYNVNIWDTNTHNILPADERRRIAEQYYPYFGKEISCPVTSPIVIGDDCWLGQNTTILKGTHLENEVITGYNTIIAGKTIPQKTTVVTDTNLKIIERK